jgi:hypothetical protein
MTITEPGLAFATCDDPILRCGGTATGLKGYGVPETAIVVPMHSSLALVGTMDKASLRMKTQRGFVAAVNEHVMHGADRYVWSNRPRFVFDWYEQHLRDPRRAFIQRGRRGSADEASEERRAHLPASQLAAAYARKLVLGLEEEA